MSKKVLHIIIGLNVGGAELMLKRLVLHSQQKGEYQHEVVSLTDLGVVGKTLVDQGIPVYTLGMTSVFKLPVIFFKLKKLIQQVRPDVVQTWMYHADFLGGLAAKQVGIDNIIWGIRNSALDSNSGTLKKMIRKACALASVQIPKKIVCVAHKAKDLHVSIGYCKDKMIVIPNGFDIKRFNIDDELRSEYRNELNIEKNKLVIGNIGRFTPAKNQVNFIKACIALIDKGYDFDVIMAGRDISINNSEIKNLIGSRKNFKLVEQLNQPEKFYNAIDVFCLSSITEGFPNVLGEAMATERVCLTTDAGDAREILGNCGYHINDPSSDAIAEALETHILSKDLSSLMGIGKIARMKIVDNYSLDKIVLDFEKLYLKN